MQCVTNTVVTNFTANVLLAVGAAPAMVDIPGEAGLFAEVAGASLINLGTIHEEQRTAMRETAEAAARSATPWVLDPVAVGGLPIRTALANELLQHQPTAIRGNASEVIALAGLGSGGRGVNAVDNPDTALPAATHLATTVGAVVAVSGAVDLVTDGADVVRVDNGHSLLTSVTGGGCALGAVTAAFLALDAEPLAAAVAATAVYTVAAERSAGPGSFAVAFLDVLHSIDDDAVVDRVALS